MIYTNERKPVDDPRYTKGQGAMLCIAILLLGALFIGVRLANPKQCKCNVCTDTTCKVCSCKYKEKKCGDPICPGYKTR